MINSSNVFMSVQNIVMLTFGQHSRIKKKNTGQPTSMRGPKRGPVFLIDRTGVIKRVIYYGFVDGIALRIVK